MKLSRRMVLGGVGATAITGCDRKDGEDTRSTGTTPARPPNIVYIYADQHRGNIYGAAGDPAAITPTLDAFAQQAVLFHNSFTCAPLCRPARITMMTGQYVFQHLIDHNLDPVNPTMPSHVRRIRDEAGYHTMVIGKTDFYDEPGNTQTDEHRAIHETFGFSDSFELLGQTEQTYRGSPYSDWLTATTPKGERDKYARYNAYHAQYDWFSPPPDVDPWLLSTFDHMDQFCARNAVEWIQNAPTDKPFYLQVNFPGPHNPFNATTEFRALYDLAKSPFPPAVLVQPENPSPLVDVFTDLKYEEWTPETIRDLKLSYYATISLLDDAVSQVLAALEAAGRLEDTWIIYHADHGELLGDHFLTGKIVPYEGSIRVPLMIRPPGGRAARQSDILVGSVDVTATLLEIAGLETTVESGFSLLENATGDADVPLREEVAGGDMGYFFLRSDRHKIGYDPVQGVVTEMYDLEADPDEIVNLKDDVGAAKTRQQLVDRLQDYLATYPPNER